MLSQYLSPETNSVDCGMTFYFWNRRVSDRCHRAFSYHIDEYFLASSGRHYTMQLVSPYAAVKMCSHKFVHLFQHRFIETTSIHRHRLYFSKFRASNTDWLWVFGWQLIVSWLSQRCSNAFLSWRVNLSQLNRKLLRQRKGQCSEFFSLELFTQLQDRLSDCLVYNSV